MAHFIAMRIMYEKIITIEANQVTRIEELTLRTMMGDIIRTIGTYLIEQNEEKTDYDRKIHIGRYICTRKKSINKLKVSCEN